MSEASKRSKLRSLARITLGALAGLVLATTALVVAIIVSEYAISRGWLERYDDATAAFVTQGILVGAPIVGGWKAWTS